MTTDDKEEKLVDNVAYIALSIPLMFWSSFVEWKVWEWFIVPIFHTPHLGYWVLMILTTIPAVYLHHEGYKKTPEEERVGLLGRLILWTVLMVLAYIAKP